MENQHFYGRCPQRGHGGAMGFKRFAARGPRRAKTPQDRPYDGLRTCIYMLTCIHIYIHPYVRTYVHTYIHTYVRTYIHKHRHTYVHTYIHNYLLTYIHSYWHTYILTYVHTYIYLHTYRQTDTSIHTYIPETGHAGPRGPRRRPQMPPMKS